MRNPCKPKLPTEANERRTQERIEQYQGKVALLNTWEAQPESVQADNHDYIIELRATIRNVKNYLLHRADAKIRI
jgi:hypothetical protein